MRWRTTSLVVGVVLLFGLTPVFAQVCVNVSTGFDDASGSILGDGVADDSYTVDAGALPEAAYTVPGGAFPIPPWLANDERSRWIGFNTFESNAPPGTYTFEVRFTLPPEVDASKAVLIGGWAVDDSSAGVDINENSTGIAASGFGTLTPFPRDAGLGFFVSGENVIRFQVVNSGTVDNPCGLRVDACVGVPAVEERPYDLSTGFDQANRVLVGDGLGDDDYILTGPGIGPVAPTAIHPDDLLVPPWLANSVRSRWVGLSAPQSSGPVGEYRYVIEVDLPPEFEASRAVLKGGMTADDQVIQVLVNGTSAGLWAAGSHELTPFPIEAGSGLFVTGKNTIEFVVVNNTEGPTALRVDGEVALGPPPVEAQATILRLDTGFDEGTDSTIANALPDDNYAILGPPGSDIGWTMATVVHDDASPIPPWIGSSSLSKWIGPQADSNGPWGLYVFKMKVIVPAWIDAGAARLVGSWATDNTGTDILINGVSAGLSNTVGFTAFTPFPPDAGLGLFQSGENEVRFLIDNAAPGTNPIGLRVEGVVGIEAPRPRSISTGVNVRGIGPLPGGALDDRYIVLGPAGSGIGPQRAVLVTEDGSPIPPWLAGSADGRWIGLEGDDTIGPPGEYAYELAFTVGPEFNPARLALVGGWAAAGSGVDVLLNGGSLGIAAPGPEVLTPFPDNTGMGRFLAGANILEFLVENGAQGPTGLRVEGSFEAIAAADPFDISTGFNQASAETLADGDPDDDYTVTDPDLNTGPATVVPEDGYPVPPWIAGTATSRWIGVSTEDSFADAGVHTFQTSVTLTQAEHPEEAYLVGCWAADNQGVDILINGVSTGATTAAGYEGFTMFQPEFGLGLFQDGTNTIVFVVSNVDDLPNPMGLRVDAVLRVGEEPASAELIRMDLDGDGGLKLKDVIWFLAVFLFGTEKQLECPDAADANDDGRLGLTDAIYMLSYLFLTGDRRPPAKPPFPLCGVDPTEDNLDLGPESKHGVCIHPGCPP